MSDPIPTGRPVVVTGAAGFIGSHVAEALVDQGQRVVGVDNFDPFYDARVKRRNLDGLIGRSDLFEFRELDLCDRGALDSLFARTRPAGVIHLAAKAGVRPSIADPAGYVRANVEATATVLDACRGTGVSRCVVASSSSVYGNGSRVPFSEDDAALEPISPYAASKRATELIAYSHWHLNRMPVACLRFFTVYGPRQRPDLAIHTFMSKLARGETLRVFGDGTSSRDYTFIDDIVRGVLAAYDRVPAHGFRIWNLGGSRPVTLSDLIATVEKVMGVAARVERLPMQAGDVEQTWADLSRARRELGYEPSTPFERGVAAQWDWLRAASAR